MRGKTRRPQVTLAGWSRWRGQERVDTVQSASILTHILSILACLLQKLQHRLSQPLNGACVHFVSWGDTTETARERRVSRRLVIVNLRALHRNSVRGMYGIRAAAAKARKARQLARPKQIASMNKKGGTPCSRQNRQDECALGSGGSAGGRSSETRCWLITCHPWPAAWWFCHHPGRSALATAER